MIECFITGVLSDDGHPEVTGWGKSCRLRLQWPRPAGKARVGGYASIAVNENYLQLTTNLRPQM
jgi:hypothetical protein